MVLRQNFNPTSGDANNDVLHNGTCCITKFLWVGSNKLAGDEIVVTDADDNIIWNVICEANGNNNECDFASLQYFKGVIIREIPNGTLYLYKE